MWTDRESGGVVLVLTEVQRWHPPESSVQPEWAGAEYDHGALTNLSVRSTDSPADPALRPNPPPSALPVTLRANPSPRNHATLSVFSSGFCSDVLLHSASDRWHRRSRNRTRPRLHGHLSPALLAKEGFGILFLFHWEHSGAICGVTEPVLLGADVRGGCGLEGWSLTGERY